MKKYLFLLFSILFFSLNLNLAVVRSEQVIEQNSDVVQASAFFNKELSCLAENIYNESAFQSYEGKLAVGTVTLNRANNARFPSNVCGVVQQKIGSVCQFSWFCNAVKHKKDPYEWQQVLDLAKRLLTGEIKHDKIYEEGALYFHATYVQPLWSKQKMLVKKIGDHLFYRERK